MTEGQEKFPQYAEAFAALETLVADVMVAQGIERPTEVSCYVFGEPPHGFRIAEIGMVWRSEGVVLGSSWMRSDEGTGNMLLSAEDFVLNFGDHGDFYGDDDEPSGDFENEARWRIVMAMTDNNSELAKSFWVKRKRPEEAVA